MEDFTRHDSFRVFVFKILRGDGGKGVPVDDQDVVPESERLMGGL